MALGLSLSLAFGSPQAAEAPVSAVRVVARYPHDPGAFTQGLVIVEGELYEGTGGFGESSLRRVELKTGRVLERVELPSRWFGEGITDWQDELIQLTWRAGIGLRYARASLEPLGRFAIAGEGWGLTHDGRHWIMSDGSADLRFLDPVDGRELRRLRVLDGAAPVDRLNELEYVRGEIWANLWYQDRLVRIDPADGRVLGYVDLSDLWPAGQPRRSEQVLNGIAFDRETKQLLVTGKHWPWLYEVELVDDRAAD
ncbi:MAG: glutaminyl-peptide cyclotransferase [Lamprobacter sp.]|uniref:glutaminyl-peptide cyclotransferase n=1 Tax=Lamprobacter sp. TaxID=3100796 RepID=UPI002B25D8CB|nr:glutaminyl-peptide cyclotransferase [Lamprobacter sp.]MEA3640321.1 glutaminyl-peptide cyclotransferase [Lamprobacter sp.]